MIFELINKQGVVLNTITAQLEFMLQNYELGTYRQVEEVEVPKIEVKRITRLAFLNRFTDAEAVAIDLAQQGMTVTAALFRRFMQKVNAAMYIDLDREETRTGVQGLEQVGLLAAGRALQILDNPVQDFEIYKGQ